MDNDKIAQLGNWNPQLLREFRGRLKSRSLIAAVVLSLTLQGLILLVFLDSYSEPSDWVDLWVVFMWSLPYLLFAIGSYYIVSNLVQEEKTGTLNFIRLSPRPAWQILLGKLVGVPILPVIAIGLVIPLHLLSGLLGSVPIFFMLSFYLILIVDCILVWSLALLFGFFGSTRSGLAGQANSLAFAFTALIFFILSPLLMTWNLQVTWKPLIKNFEGLDSFTEPVYWGWLELSNNAFFSHSFTLINLSICIALTWRVLLRRFRRPLSPLLSRRQSYTITAYIIFLTIGATFFPIVDESYRGFSIRDLLGEVGIIFILSVAYVTAIAMMSSICPSRQALVEWSRTKSSGVMDYLWSDKSPAILSFGIILLILNGLIIPWIILGNIELPEINEIPNRLGILVTVIGGTSTLFMIGSFMQFVMAQKLRFPNIWVVGCLLLWWAVPPIVLGILSADPDRYAVASAIWAFFGYPMGHLEKAEFLGPVLAGILGQCCVTAFWLMSLKQSLQKIQQLRNDVTTTVQA